MQLQHRKSKFAKVRICLHFRGKIVQLNFQLLYIYDCKFVTFFSVFFTWLILPLEIISVTFSFWWSSLCYLLLFAVGKGEKNWNQFDRQIKEADHKNMIVANNSWGPFPMRSLSLSHSLCLLTLLSAVWIANQTIQRFGFS